MVGLGHQQVVGGQTGLEQAGEVDEEGNAVAEWEVLALEGVARHGADEQTDGGAHGGQHDGQAVGLPDGAALDDQLIGRGGKFPGKQGDALGDDVILRFKGGAKDHQEGEDAHDGENGDEEVADAADHIVRTRQLDFAGAFQHAVLILCHSSHLLRTESNQARSSLRWRSR